MNKDHEFLENAHGVHLLCPGADGRTLCGDVEEGDECVGIEAARKTDKRTVTCEACRRIILGCRGVKIAKCD